MEASVMRYLRYSHMLILVFFALLVCSYTATSTAQETALYVSTEGDDSWAGSIDRPFATIQKARDAIRAIKEKDPLTSPVTVYLRGGLYELSETLVFTPEDSGTETCPITYKAYSEEKPIISGGRKITGVWEDYSDNYSGWYKSMSSIQVCTVDAVKEGNWNFRQLFLNGTRRIRSRTPNEGYFRSARTDEDLGRDSFKYREGDIRKWHNLNDVEVITFYSWNESRRFITELDEDNRIATLSTVAGRNRSGSRYYVENTLEGVNQNGEWYLDRHEEKLYYCTIDKSQLSELRAPILNELVRLEGSFKDQRYVEYINLVGLTFSDADYNVPEEGIPALPDVGDIYGPSAITFEATRFCTFEDNTVRNVGTYALEINGDGNRIIGNEIYDTGSGGIITRSFGKERNEISYNHIHDCGKIFHSAVGINIDDGGGLIAHNLIHDISHSGIYARHFTTKYHLDLFPQERERRNQEQGCIIEFNEIHDTMQMVNDGAGIFIRDDRIVIRNNLVHHIYPYRNPENLRGYAKGGTPGWGIYLGCETRNCLVENNVVHDVAEGMYVWHHGQNNTLVNNIIVDAKVRQVRYMNPKDLEHENIRFIRNIVCYSDIDAELFNIYSYEDQEIIERTAPVESDYNLLFHTGGGEFYVKGTEGFNTLQDWKQKGYEEHSIIADPLFVDPENDDYSLRPDSPAFKLGFKPIDLSTVGLRGRK